MITLREDATACPTGWTDVTAADCDAGAPCYSGMGIRGANTDFATASDTDIPDVAGHVCSGASASDDSGGGAGTGCSGTTSEYDDILDIAEMALHGHPFRASTSSSTGDGSGGMLLDIAGDANHVAFTGTPSATLGEQVGGTGGGTNHNHPFMTVRFCKKD